jgi:hypothetical protein
MRQNFLLLDCDAPMPGKTGHGVKHYLQQTGFTCGAACLSMMTGLTEEQCRKLAKTTRTGTFTHNIVPALVAAGHVAHHVQVRGALEDHLPELVLQSMRWPLYLSLVFVHEGRDSLNRRRKYERHHACVLAGGRFLDPGELHELDPEAIGHLHQRGVKLDSYILLER